MQIKLTIDLETLTSTDHTCDSCLGGKACCCAVYDINLTEDEAARTSGALPLAASFKTNLADDMNIFDEEDDGSLSIDKDDNGDCALSFRVGGKTLCALHAAALKAKIAPHTMKPSACTLWPLSISEPPDMQLSICDDAYEFHCTTRLAAPKKEISPALLDSIEALFGPDVRDQIQDAARNGLKQITLPIS
jgi:hypothetical protein